MSNDLQKPGENQAKAHISPQNRALSYQQLDLIDYPETALLT